MTATDTRHVMAAYMDALLAFRDIGPFLADGVTMTFMGTDRIVAGRDAVCRTIKVFHEAAFSSAIDVKALVCGDGEAVLEAEFIGTHIGDFEGLTPSLRAVRVPYVAGYTLTGHKIAALRLYFPFELLMRQLTATAEPAMA